MVRAARLTGVEAQRGHLGLTVAVTVVVTAAVAAGDPHAHQAADR